MKGQYIEAVLALLNQGKNPSEVFSGLKQALEKKGHGKLYASILHGVLTKLRAVRISTQAVVTVSATSDAKKMKNEIEEALAILHAEKSYEVVEDQSIIGGFTLLQNNMLLDKSYKTALINLYRSIIR